MNCQTFKFLKLGVRSLIAEVKFFSLKALKSLQNLVNSMSNIPCSFVQEKSTYFETCQKLCFARFSQNNEKWTKVPCVVTP